MNKDHNQNVTPGYYWATPISVTAVDAGDPWPRLDITLEIGPMHESVGGARFAAVLHGTEAAAWHRARFAQSYRIVGNRFADARGRWAMVRVVLADDGSGAAVSAVRFVPQLPQARANSLILERAQALGEVSEETVLTALSQQGAHR